MSLPGVGPLRLQQLRPADGNVDRRRGIVTWPQPIESAGRSLIAQGGRRSIGWVADRTGRGPDQTVCSNRSGVAFRIRETFSTDAESTIRASFALSSMANAARIVGVTCRLWHRRAYLKLTGCNALFNSHRLRSAAVGTWWAECHADNNEGHMT